MVNYSNFSFFLFGAAVLGVGAIDSCEIGESCKEGNCYCPSGYQCKEGLFDASWCKKISGSGSSNNKVTPDDSNIRKPTIPKTTTGTGGKTKVCFPGSSTIQLAGGKTKRLDQIGVDDVVASIDDYGNFEYSPVIYVPHLKNDQASDFLKISCKGEGNKNIRATQDHVIFISKSKDDPFDEALAVPARDVEVGSWLYTVMLPEKKDGADQGRTNKCQVSKVEPVMDNSGVYSIYTKNGRVVVDGIVASSYVGGEWILGADHTGVHWIASIHRLVYEMGGAESSLFRYLNHFFSSLFTSPVSG